MKRLLLTAAAAALVALTGAAPAGASGSHALIQGSGSSWAANAVNQWVADVASEGIQVVYTPNGSATGRKDYANRSTDFGVSDVPFGSDPSSPDTSQGRSFAYLPVAAGGTSFPYHLDIGSYRVRNLRLSGLTLAKIFTGGITNWNDPAIAKDNNGRALPSLPIIPVVHAEGAGVSDQFTRYLAKQYPSTWAPCNGGQAKETEFYPVNCGRSSGPMRALNGSDGVMNFIKSSAANGSIGMEEYSFPLLSNFPAVKLLNTAGYYTLPTQYNVAVALTKAVINENPTSANYLIQNLDAVYTNPDKRTYPLSSYVYAIIPTKPDDSRMTTAKRQTLADFLYYSICQGQQEIGPIGYSSLPINLVEDGFGQIGKLKKADPDVDLTNRDVATCHNPTFIAGKPRVNHLAVIAPEPPSCDKTGAGPCSATQGAYNGSPGGVGRANSGSGGTGGSTGTGSTGSATSGTSGSSGSGGSAGTGTSGATGTTGSGTAGGAGSGATSGRLAGGTGSLLGGGSGTGGLGAGTSGGAGAGTGGADSANGTADNGVPVIPPALAARDSTGPSGALMVLAVALLLVAILTPVLVSRLLARRDRGT